MHHSTLNTKTSPCLESRHYSYSSCLNRKIVQHVGCQSFWTNFSGIPFCSDLSQYFRYLEEYNNIVSLEKNKLLTKTGCLRPCQYMEYTVSQVTVKLTVNCHLSE